MTRPPVNEKLTTLYLRRIPERVVREAKAVAARRGSTLSKLVAETLSRSLEAGGDATEREGGLEEDMRWYERNRARLLPRYRGEYIAILGRQVLDHDRSFEALAKRVFARLGVRSVFMPRAEPRERAVRLRSPRLSAS